MDLIIDFANGRLLLFVCLLFVYCFCWSIFCFAVIHIYYMHLQCLQLAITKCWQTVVWKIFTAYVKRYIGASVYESVLLRNVCALKPWKIVRNSCSCGYCMRWSKAKQLHTDIVKKITGSSEDGREVFKANTGRSHKFKCPTGIHNIVINSETAVFAE